MKMFRNFLKSLKERAYQDDIRELEEKRVGRIEERNSMGKQVVGDSLLTIGITASAILGAIAAYYFLSKRDEEAPQIDKLDFRERVEKGQSQSILVCAKEQNPSEYATLKLNGTSIELPLSERNNGEGLLFFFFRSKQIF